MGKQTFLKGALILAVASLFVKTLGFLYQIFVVRIIGTEGIGIFNMVYPLYITALVIVTAGIPPAVAKYVSEESSAGNTLTAEKILTTAMGILVVISTTGAFLLLLFAPRLIRLLYADPRVIPSFLILVPTLLLVAVSSAIKGFFQGHQDMRPTAYNQLIEQTIRFISGLTLVYLLYPFGLTWTSVGLATAILLSEFGGLLYLRHIFLKTSSTGKLISNPSPPVLVKLLSFGIPVTLTRIVGSLVSAAEASLIPQQLIKAGNTLSQAASFYGELTAVAFTLLQIPSTLTYSLSISIMPAISDAQSRKQKELLRQRTTEAVSITLLAGVPSAVILYYWGPIMADLLFKAEQAGTLLHFLVFGSIFLYLAQTSSGILQGIGCVNTILLTTITAGLLRLGGIYYFGGQPGITIRAVTLSYVVSFIVLALLNLLAICCRAGFKFEPFFYLRLALSGFVLAGLLKLAIPLVRNNIALLILLTLIFAGFFLFVLFILQDKYARIIVRQLFSLKRQPQ